MNTQLHTTQISSQIKSLHKILITILLLCSTTSVYAQDSYQLKTLFEPSNAVLLAEARGRVIIYDGLKSVTVDKAMDEQFNRIDNMMFIRTIYAQNEDEYEVGDDGCGD